MNKIPPTRSLISIFKFKSNNNATSVIYKISNQVIPTGIFFTVSPSLFKFQSIPFVFSVDGSLPAGLTINSSNGTISGTPTQIDTKTIRIVGASPKETIYSNYFTIDVYTAPSFSTIPTESFYQQASVNVNFSSYVNNPSGFTLSYSSDTLPTGLILNSTTGILSGTPTATVVLSNFKLYLTYTHGLISSNGFTLSVTKPAMPSGATIWWKCNEAPGATQLLDSSGHSRNSDDHNGTVFDFRSPGIHFDKEGSPVSNGLIVQTTGVFDDGGIGEAFKKGTISIFWKADNPAGTRNAVSGNHTSGGYNGIVECDPGVGLFLGDIGSGQVVFGDVDGGNTSMAKDVTSPFEFGVDTMWTLTYDTPTLKLYKNGVLVETKTQTNNNGTDTPLRLGANITAGGIYHDLVTYNRALSDSDTLTLYLSLV